MRPYRFISCLVPALLVLAGCYPQTPSEPNDVTVRPVEVVRLRQESATETFTLVGSTEPWQEAILYFEVSGVVEELFVEEGETVEPGARIARLVLDDYQLARSRAEAELDTAQARLDLLNAGTRKEDLEAARADHDRAQVRATFWRNELRRVAKLYQQKAVAASELEQVRREHDAAEQEERSTKARLDRAEAGPRKEEIEAADAEVQARKQAVALATRQLEKATLRAPFRGRVEQRLLDVGAYINVFPTGGVPVVHLVDLEKVDAVIAVPETLRSRFAAKLRPSVAPPIEVVSAVDPQVRAQGEIISLGHLADRASGTYPLRVRVSNPDGRFTGGMVVIAETTVETSRRAIRIPVTALCRAYGQPPYVLLIEPIPTGEKLRPVIAEGSVIAREVQLGPIAGDRVEISAGLSEGELLIVRGQDRVVVGDKAGFRIQRAAQDPQPSTLAPDP